jgi:hypothetical protein
VSWLISILRLPDRRVVLANRGRQRRIVPAAIIRDESRVQSNEK